MEPRQKQLLLLIWLSAAASVLASASLLLIPSDEKNAWLLGYSASRLALLVSLVFPAFLFTWLGLSIRRHGNYSKSLVRRLDHWLAVEPHLLLAFPLTLLLLVAGSLSLKWIATLPEQDAYKTYLVRLAPTIALTTFFSLEGLYFALGPSPKKNLRRWAVLGRTRFRQSRAATIPSLILINLCILTVLLYSFEWFLKQTEPCIRLRESLPFDSNDYYVHPLCYIKKEIPDLTLGKYTWGVLIVKNRNGFRERELASPKPENVCRIMVLGDSFTWGVGLPVENRYTNVAEALLTEAFPEQDFEVLNFAVSGGPTTEERDILQENKDLVQPDLVVVGFFYNDPEPRNSVFQQQTSAFEKKYGRLVNTISGFLKSIHFPFIAQKFDAAVHNVASRPENPEPWYVTYDRLYYDPRSQPWKDFTNALKDIYTMNEEMGNPPPIFVILTNEIMTPEKLSLEKFILIQKWQDQAESAARQIGFLAYNHDADLLNGVALSEVEINALDPHPSAKVHQIFGEKLFDTLAGLYRKGVLCDH